MLDQAVSNAGASRSIRLFLADGTPHGLVVAEIGNWSGKVLAASRSRLTCCGGRKRDQTPIGLGF